VSTDIPSGGPVSGQEPGQEWSGFVKKTHAVDAVFAEFADNLPESARATADQLAHLLQLAPNEVPWSQVFPHEFTLAAPALVADALPSIPTSRVRSAVLAHMLCVLEGVARERASSGRIEIEPDLKRLWAFVRTARDEAAARMGFFVCAPESQFDLAFHRFEQVLAVERPLLDSLEPVDFALYDRITAAKQSLLVPACESIVQTAGWPAPKRRELREMIIKIGCGLRTYEDVVDWEDAQVHGGAWAVLLARELNRKTRADRSARAPSVRTEVLESGVLALLLQRAHRAFSTARKIASSLELRDLSRWTAAQALALDELRRAEQEFAGYAVRAKALRGWAETVLT